MLKKLFGKRAKVDSANKLSESALGMFAKANKQLDVANEQLIVAAQEAREKAKELLAEANRAEAIRNSNQSAQIKLQEFIPSTQV